jgi:hypothetical protein
MRATGVALVVAASLLASPPARAVPWSADDLRDACRDGELYYLYGACGGYLAAVHDATSPNAVCLPEDATIFDLEPAADAVAGLDVVDGESGPALALRALQAAFPCE